MKRLALLIVFVLISSMVWAKSLVDILIYNPSDKELAFSELHKP